MDLIPRYTGFTAPQGAWIERALLRHGVPFTRAANEIIVPDLPFDTRDVIDAQCRFWSDLKGAKTR